MTHLFALKRSNGAACYHDCEGTNLRTWTGRFLSVSLEKEDEVKVSEA